MKIHQFLPSNVLKPFISRFLVTEIEGDLTRQLLPGTAPVMALRFKGAIYLNNIRNHIPSPKTAATWMLFIKSLGLKRK